MTPLWLLTIVELRKLADTRAGIWLLAIVAAATAATVVVVLTAAPPTEQNLAAFFGFGLLPASLLLPVLGILSMTGEWSQRTALTTFVLVPARWRVVVAKVGAAALIGIASTAATGVLAVLGNLLAIALGGDGRWTLDAGLVARFLLLEVILVLMGSAFGALLLNSPLAIVVYFALPTLWSALGDAVRWLHTAAGWLDVDSATGPLTEPGMTGGDWARLGTSVALWVALPLALGTVRILRRDIS